MSEYTTDIEFVTQFNPKQTPARLNYTAALNGMPPRPLDQPFTYCDLGCGPGMTVNALAAAHPNGEFWGIDLNANHIRMGRNNAQETGLKNAHFLEANISDLENQELPQFDFIAINGLFSWLSDERRSEAMDFLARSLKPGGYAYIHYIAYPGHALSAPIYRLLQDKFNELDHFDSTPEDKVMLTQQFLKLFKDTQKTFMSQIPSANILIDRIVNSTTEAFLHDYINPHRHAFYFGDIEAGMASRGMMFTGTADFWMNHLVLCIPPEGRALIQGATDRRSLERIKDFAILAGGRRDIYLKPDAAQAEVNAEPLLDIPMGAVSNDNPNDKAGFPGGTVQTRSEPYLTIQTLLYERPRTLRELFEAPELADRSRVDIKRAMTFLAAAERIEPFVTTDTRKATGEGPAGLSTYNAAVLERAVLRTDPHNAPVVHLASPVTGRTITLSWQDAAALHALATQPTEKVIDWLEDLFHQRGLVLHNAGEEAELNADTTRVHLEANLPPLHARLHDMTKRLAVADLPAASGADAPSLEGA